MMIAEHSPITGVCGRDPSESPWSGATPETERYFAFAQTEELA